MIFQSMEKVTLWRWWPGNDLGQNHSDRSKISQAEHTNPEVGAPTLSIFPENVMEMKDCALLTDLVTVCPLESTNE